MEEKYKQSANNDKRRANVPENDNVLNEEILIKTEEDVKLVDKSSKSLSFCERMKGLSPYCCPLKDRIRNKTV